MVYKMIDFWRQNKNTISVVSLVLIGFGFGIMVRQNEEADKRVDQLVSVSTSVEANIGDAADVEGFVREKESVAMGSASQVALVEISSNGENIVDLEEETDKSEDEENTENKEIVTEDEEVEEESEVGDEVEDVATASSQVVEINPSPSPSIEPEVVESELVVEVFVTDKNGEQVATEKAVVELSDTEKVDYESKETDENGRTSAWYIPSETEIEIKTTHPENSECSEVTSLKIGSEESHTVMVLLNCE